MVCSMSQVSVGWIDCGLPENVRSGTSAWTSNCETQHKDGSHLAENSPVMSRIDRLLTLVLEEHSIRELMV